MKKLLLLTLAISAVSFAAPAGNSDQSASMNIKARIIKPLTVETNGDIDFGKVIQGAEATSTGKQFTISGEKAENVIVTINDQSNLDSIQLTSTATQDKLTVDLEGANGGTITLDGNGNHTLPITAKITTANSNVAPATYQGTLTTKVIYQ